MSFIFLENVEFVEKCDKHDFFFFGHTILYLYESFTFKHFSALESIN